MCISILPMCVYVTHLYLVPLEARREHWISLELELQTSCELPCGFWELNPVPLEEHPLLISAEPSPQPPNLPLKMYKYLFLGVNSHAK